MGERYYKRYLMGSVVWTDENNRIIDQKEIDNYISKNKIDIKHLDYIEIDDEELEDEEINELAEKAEFKIVNASDVGKVIEQNFNKLKELKQSLRKTDKKVKASLCDSQLAKDRRAGVIFNKTNIEYIQRAVVTLAEAQDALTDTQKISFEYQRALTYFCKYLLFLGASNIATNRQIITTIEEKLSNASKKELNSQEKAELLNVVKDLKSQQDVFEKQERTALRVKELNEKVEELQEEVNYLKSTGISKPNYDLIVSKIKDEQPEKEPDVIYQQQSDSKTKIHPMSIVALILASAALLVAIALLIRFSPINQ